MPKFKQSIYKTITPKDKTSLPSTQRIPSILASISTNVKTPLCFNSHSNTRIILLLNHTFNLITIFLTPLSLTRNQTGITETFLNLFLASPLISIKQWVKSTIPLTKITTLLWTKEEFDQVQYHQLISLNSNRTITQLTQYLSPISVKEQLVIPYMQIQWVTLR